MTTRDVEESGSPLEQSPRVTCGVCERELKQPETCKDLYGIRVCRKCRDGFANRRQAAYLVDYVLYTIVFFVTVTALGSLSISANLDSDFHDALGITFAGIVGPLLFCCKDGFSGYSPGKRLFGVRVVDTASREPIGFRQSVRRNLVLMIPILGFWGCVFTMMKGHRWGDRWANTIVIWNKHATTTPFEPRPWICRKCGYDLTGNTSGRCPECFEPIPAEASEVIERRWAAMA